MRSHVRRVWGCTMRVNASWVMDIWDPLWTEWQTDTCKNITFPQLPGRAVKIVDLVDSALKLKKGCTNNLMRNQILGANSVSVTMRLKVYHIDSDNQLMFFPPRFSNWAILFEVPIRCIDTNCSPVQSTNFSVSQSLTGWKEMICGFSFLQNAIWKPVVN